MVGLACLHLVGEHERSFSKCDALSDDLVEHRLSSVLVPLEIIRENQASTCIVSCECGPVDLNLAAVGQLASRWLLHDKRLDLNRGENGVQV